MDSIKIRERLVDRFYEGRWIEGVAYVICKECGSFLPVDHVEIHSDWHDQIVEVLYK